MEFFGHYQGVETTWWSINFFIGRIDGKWSFEVFVSSDLTSQTHSGPLRFVGKEERRNWVVEFTRLY